MVEITKTPGGIKYLSGTLNGELAFHVKQVSDSIDASEYGCCFLISQYFTAESDYYKINLKQSDGHKDILGWLYHITLLSENAEFYEGMDEFLLKYLHIGLSKLLNYSIEKGLLKNDSGTLDDLGLSDNLIILIYRHSICSEEDIINLYPSLYDNGFIVIEEPEIEYIPVRRINLYRKEKIDEFKLDTNRSCINLSRVAPVFSNNLFVKSLFISNLPMIDDEYLRYLMLYQVVEILMSIEYGNRYFEYIERYGNEKRHNLMEKFGELSSESRMIGKMYEIGASGAIHEDFMSAAKQLLDKVGEGDFKDNPHFPDYMYKIRNMLVHNLSIMRDYQLEMRRISDIYEYVIVDLIERTTIDVKKDKRLFVIDMNKTYEENQRLLSGIFNEEG